MVDSIWQESVKLKFGDYPTDEEKDKYFGQALIRKWKIEFERRCWDSPQFAEISFHVLFAQMTGIRNLRIKSGHNISDMRVHMILFQRSGTGKGRGFNFTAEMSRLLNLEYMSPDDTTDAKLVGRFQRVEGEREMVQVRGYLDPQRIPRVAIIVQNEATLIIDAKQTDFSKKFMNFYQKAMNPIGTPDNLIEAGTVEMGEQEIRINPDLSFYLTTYPPDKLLQTITKAGFIQRMITLYNVINYEKRQTSWDKIGDITGKDLSEDVTDYIPEIIEALKFISNYYRKNTLIYMPDETAAYCSNVMKQIYLPLEKVNDAMREHLGDFVPRVYENTIKLAFHHALCRLSHTVDVEDITYALNVMRPSWLRLITFMEESDEIVAQTTKRWEKIKYETLRSYDIIIKEQKKRNRYENGWVKRETLVKMLSGKLYGWNVSKATARARLLKLTEDFGFFTEKREGGIRYLKKHNA